MSIASQGPFAYPHPSVLTLTLGTPPGPARGRRPRTRDRIGIWSHPESIGACQRDTSPSAAVGVGHDPCADRVRSPAGARPSRLSCPQQRNGKSEGELMSSSGWGGPGTGSPGEPWQNGAPQNGPPGHPPQATPPAQPGSAGAGHGAPPPDYGTPQAPGHAAPQAPSYGTPPASGDGAPASSGHDGSQGAPWSAGGAGASWGPGVPQGPGSPQGPGGPGGPQGPGGAGQQPQRKRPPWLLIGVAMTCVLAMLLVVGGGITFLALRQGEDTPIATDTSSEGTTTPEDPESSAEESTSPPETTPAEEEGSDFRVASPVDPPRGSVEELWAVLEDNPLTEGSLPELPECELPETPVEPSIEELQAVLDAASGCLNQMWATASSDRGLPWVSPTVVVYTHPDVPSDASCDTHFSADFPRMCNLDSTIYWPVGYGTGLDLSDPADVPGAYLWDL